MKIFAYFLSFFLVFLFCTVSADDNSEDRQIAVWTLRGAFISHAQPENHKALFEFAEIMSNEEEVFKNPKFVELGYTEKAIDLFKKSAERGNAEAPKELVSFYTEREKWDLALMWSYISSAVTGKDSLSENKELERYFENIDKDHLRKIQKQAKDKLQKILKKAKRISSKPEKELEADYQKIAEALFQLGNMLFYNKSDLIIHSGLFHVLQEYVAAATMGDFKAQAQVGQLAYEYGNDYDNHEDWVVGNNLFVIEASSDALLISEVLKISEKEEHHNLIWAYVWLDIAIKSGNSLLEKIKKNPGAFSFKISELKKDLLKMKNQKLDTESRLEKNQLKTAKVLLKRQLERIRQKKEEYFKKVQFRNKETLSHFSRAEERISELFKSSLPFSKSEDQMREIPLLKSMKECKNIFTR